MAQTAQNLVLESLKSSLTSGDYSDLTIVCQSDSYKVHKVIVCSRAKFFENAIKFPGKESESTTVNLPEDDPSIVKLLIQYFYEGDYFPKCLPATPSSSTSTISAATVKSKNLKRSRDQGVYYQKSVGTQIIPHTCSDLKWDCGEDTICDHPQCGTDCDCDCVEFFCQLCNPPPDVPQVDENANQLSTHASTYAIGEQYGVVGLKELCKEKFRCACLHFWNQPAFAVAAHLVFSTTVEDDKCLRDIVSKHIADHIELVNKAEIEVLMTEFNSLAFSILKQKVAKGWR